MVNSWRASLSVVLIATALVGIVGEGTAVAATDVSVGFSGDDQVVVPNDGSLQITGDMTYELWLRPTGLGFRRNPLAKAYSGEGTITQEPDLRLTFYQGPDGGNTGVPFDPNDPGTPGYEWIQSTSPLELGVWSHVVLTRSGSSLRWYVNGVLDAGVGFSNTPVASTEPLLIGNGYENGYVGDIDEVAVYDRALSGAEVTEHYNAVNDDTLYAATVQGDNPVSFWRMDETVGPTAVDAIGTNPGTNPGTYSGSPGYGQPGPGSTNIAPLVSIDSPADGASVPEGALVGFTASVIDEDVDLVDSVVWSSIPAGVVGTGATVSTDTLALGTYVVTASVTDSGGLTGSDSITITVNASPVVSIDSPADGASFPDGALVGFTASVTDEDPDLVDSVVWSSIPAGVVGTGASVSTATLAPGTYDVTASVTDSGGLTGSDSITITVNELTEARVGLFDPGSGQWHLRTGDNGEVTSFYYGIPGDIPLFGDWDCDGIDTVGMYRPTSGFVYLRNSNDFGVADLDFFFGIPGDLPLVGDWNGNGCDTLAVNRNGQIFISNTLGTVVAEFDFFFGVPGDRAFTADFDGDGITTVGVYRESTGFVYLRNDLVTGVAEEEFFYGIPSDRIVAGDWDKDGDETVGIFRPSLARFFLANVNDTVAADIEFDFGEMHWLPVAGKF